MLKTDVNKRNETVVTDESAGSGSHQETQLVANDTASHASGLRLQTAGRSWAKLLLITYSSNIGAPRTKKAQ